VENLQQQLIPLTMHHHHRRQLQQHQQWRQQWVVWGVAGDPSPASSP
jgi:hypothetical protein